MVSKDGFFYRKNDSRRIQRYKCKHCHRKFSKSTLELECHQKKRRLNQILFRMLASGTSLRRAAYVLGINKNTVERKFQYLAFKAKSANEEFLKWLKENPVKSIQFDDLITCEHSKLKPLAVSSAVCAKTRLMLAVEVSQIPAFGHLAKFSRQKYGHRRSDHRAGLTRMFECLKEVVDSHARISSDEHKSYPEFVAKYFPSASYHQFRGERGCVTGQGELKRKTFDPLFSINHTYAMLRANINRLIRRTWSTTKKAQMLKKHLDLYMHAHNQIILKKLAKLS